MKLRHVPVTQRMAGDRSANPYRREQAGMERAQAYWWRRARPECLRDRRVEAPCLGNLIGSLRSADNADLFNPAFP